MEHDRELDILQDIQLDIRLPVVQRFDTWTRLKNTKAHSSKNLPHDDVH